MSVMERTPLPVTDAGPRVMSGRLAWRLFLALIAVAGCIAGGAFALRLVREGGFTMHMVVHVANVAVLAPALAWAMPAALTRLALQRRFTSTLLAAGFAEWAVVWFWHTPGANELATASGWLWSIEQGSFLLVAFWLWLLVVAALRHHERSALGQSIVALLLTSMHMTLLGAVISLSPLPFFASSASPGPVPALDPLERVQVGGALMLIVAGSVYLAAALICAWRLIGSPQERNLRHR